MAKFLSRFSLGVEAPFAYIKFKEFSLIKGNKLFGSDE